jgi:hypothetical protein
LIPSTAEAVELRTGTPSGDIAVNRRDEQELPVLCLRVLQGSRPWKVVYDGLVDGRVVK